jgi:hypothetical protein
MEWEHVDWINLAEERYKWWVLAVTIMNRRFHIMWVIG